MNPDQIKFDDRGLVAAVAQDRLTLRVLMLAWMNREAVEKTLETGKAHYWSRSRGELWLKGETSGNVQHVKGVHYDCDADAVLLVVDPAGPACHTGEETCFYRDMDGGELGAPSGEAVLTGLGAVLKERKGAEAGKSYVASLYAGGVEKIGGKVREEAEELIEAAAEKDGKEVVHEAADLIFHAMVMLAHRDVEMSEVFEELDRRFGTSGHEEKASRKKAGKD